MYHLKTLPNVNNKNRMRGFFHGDRHRKSQMKLFSKKGFIATKF